MDNKNKAIEAFDNYAKGYDTNDVNVKLKIYHTYRVADFAELIGESIGANKDFSWFLGLLHDIGRFEQLRRFGTFKDRESLDHAKLSADILFKDGLIDTFPKEFFNMKDVSWDEAMAIADIAIRSHNKLNIPDNLDTKTAMYCNILRDADKVDIFRVSTEPPFDNDGRIVEEGVSKGKIEPARDEVMTCVYEHRCIPMGFKPNEFEVVIIRCAMGFELVYPKSRQLTIEQGYLFKLMDLDLSNQVHASQLATLRQEIKRTLSES